jgi:hypothetical protein
MTLTLVMVNAAAPVLVRVTPVAGLDDPTDWLAKETLVGEKTTVAEIPVPESGTVCSNPLPLSVKVSVPPMVPAVVGVKLTLTVQLAFAATPAPQLLVCE